MIKWTSFKLWFVGIVLVSFLTTMHGIKAVIGLDGAMGYGVAALFSALFQLTIVIGWRSFGKSLGDRAVVSALGFALLGATASVGSAIFASSTNVEMLNSEFLNRQQAVENRDVLIKPAAQLVNFTTELSQKLDEYAQVAGQRARIEAETGSSCEGPPKKPTCGSLCKLRQQQKKDASDQASLSRSLRDKAVALQASAVDVRTQQQVNGLFIDVNKLIGSSEISQIRAWAANEDNGFKTGFPVAGKVLMCSDKEASRLVASIKDYTSKKIDVPSTPPLVTAQSVGDAAVRNIHALVNVLSALLFQPGTLKTMLADPTVLPFVPPWAIAFGIELICSVLAAREGWAVRGHFGDPVGRALDPAVKNRQQSILWFIRHLSVHTYVGRKKQTWLVIPANATSTSLEVENLPHFLKLKQPSMRGVLDIRSISHDEGVRARIMKAAGEGTQFTVWEFPDYETKVASLARQLGLERREETKDTPPTIPHPLPLVQ